MIDYKRLEEIREQCEHGERVNIDDTLWLLDERENLLTEVDVLRAEAKAARGRALRQVIERDKATMDEICQMTPPAGDDVHHH